MVDDTVVVALPSSASMLTEDSAPVSPSTSRAGRESLLQRSNHSSSGGHSTLKTYLLKIILLVKLILQHPLQHLNLLHLLTLPHQPLASLDDAVHPVQLGQVHS